MERNVHEICLLSIINMGLGLSLRIRIVKSTMCMTVREEYRYNPKLSP